MSLGPYGLVEFAFFLIFIAIVVEGIVFSIMQQASAASSRMEEEHPNDAQRKEGGHATIIWYPFQYRCNQDEAHKSKHPSRFNGWLHAQLFSDSANPLPCFHVDSTQAGGLYVHSVEKVMSSVVLRRCENV